MKNLNYYVGITLAFIFFSVAAEAQILNKLKNAASRGMEKAIEDKVEKEANKMVQKQLEKQLGDIFGEDGGDESSPVSVDMSKILKGMGEDVTTADQYDFSGYLTMEMTTTNDKGKEQDPVLFKAYLGESEDYTGMEYADPDKPGMFMTMIFDVQNEASIILIDHKEEKSSLAYTLDSSTFGYMTEDDEIIEDPELKLEKTGNTKVILGYECEEYHVTSKEGEGYIFMTDEPIGGYSSIWGSKSPFAKNKSQEKYAKHFQNFPEGNFLEMTYVGNDGINMEMVAVEIEESASKSFVMTDYPNMMAGISEEQADK